MRWVRGLVITVRVEQERQEVEKEEGEEMGEVEIEVRNQDGESGEEEAMVEEIPREG